MIEKKEVLIVNKATGEQTKGHQVVVPSRTDSAPEAGVPQADQPPVAGLVAGETHGQKSKKPRGPLSSLFALIEYGYSRKGQPVTVKAGDLKVISSNLLLTGEDTARLRELLTQDKSFVVPRQLLLTARELREAPKVRNGLREFVGGLLEAHPIVTGNELQALVRNQEGAPSVAAAFRAIMTTDASTLRAHTHIEQDIKAGELAALKLNVIGCLAVWAMETRAMSIADLMSALLEGCWEPASSDPSESDLLRLLTQIDEPVVAGSICREFGRRVADQMRVAERSAQSAATARSELQRASTELDIARAKLAELETEVQCARHALQTERDTARVALSHLRDDLEILRTRVLRRLSDDLRLLGDGLVALTRNPPKVDVMVDHAERVAESLRGEIKKLEKG